MKIIGREAMRHGINSLGPSVNFTKTTSEIRIAKSTEKILGWRDEDSVVFLIADDNCKMYISRSQHVNAIDLKSNVKGGFAIWSRHIYNQVRDVLGVGEDARSFNARMVESAKMNGVYVMYELVLNNVNS